MKTMPPRLFVYPTLIIGLLLNAYTNAATKATPFTPTPAPTQTHFPPR